MGRVFLHHLTRGLGSVVSSPSGAPVENGFYAHLRSSGTPFSVFLGDGMPLPPNAAGPGKTSSLFSPLDGPAGNLPFSATHVDWVSFAAQPVVLVALTRPTTGVACAGSGPPRTE